MHIVTSVLAAIALIAIIIFSVQNLESDSVSFLTWSVEIPKFLVVIGAYLLGMVSGWGLFDLFKRSLRKEPK